MGSTRRRVSKKPHTNRVKCTEGKAVSRAPAATGFAGAAPRPREGPHAAPKPTTCLRPSGQTEPVSTEAAPKERKARGSSSTCPPRGYCLGWGRGGTPCTTRPRRGETRSLGYDKHPPHASVRLLRDCRQNKKNSVVSMYTCIYLYNIYTHTLICSQLSYKSAGTITVDSTPMCSLLIFYRCKNRMATWQRASINRDQKSKEVKKMKFKYRL